MDFKLFSLAQSGGHEGLVPLKLSCHGGAENYHVVNASDRNRSHVISGTSDGTWCVLQRVCSKGSPAHVLAFQMGEPRNTSTTAVSDSCTQTIQLIVLICSPTADTSFVMYVTDPKRAILSSMFLGELQLTCQGNTGSEKHRVVAPQELCDQSTCPTMYMSSKGSIPGMRIGFLLALTFLLALLVLGVLR